MKNPQIEYAILFGSQRFSSRSLSLLQIDLDHADRFAKLLKRLLAQPGANLRTIAELAVGLATSDLGLNAIQVICEIPLDDHSNARGFVKIYDDDNRIFIRLHDDPCPCLVASVAFHEVKHRAQAISGKFMSMYARAEFERDAKEFSRLIMRKYHFTCGTCGKNY